MSKEGLQSLLEIPQVVEMIKNCGLVINTDIKKIMKMARRNYISADVFNKTPIREDGRKE